jgi:uncharacterized membrane protein YeaQ/YmgE (transglycosylase-associated protein family)
MKCPREKLMSFIQIFFVVIFAVAAACIAHKFIYIDCMATPEFLAKFAGGALGAFLGPIALGHWWMGVEEVWFAPEFAGALIGAAVVAVAWKLLAHRGPVPVHHAEPKPVMQ